MRPLMVSHTGVPGGSNEVLLALLEHCPPDTAPACIFLGEGDSAARAGGLGTPTAIVGSGRARQLSLAPRLVRRLRGAIRAHQADVVFSHTVKSHLYAGVAAALEDVPCLWWQHALPGQQPLLEFVGKAWPTNAIVCSSDFTAAMQRASARGVPVHRIHPGTHLPDELPQTRSAGRHVGMVTRLQRYKRVELLLEAVPQVLAEEPEATFSVLGAGDPAVDPEYPAELNALIRELDISSAVTLHGHVDDAATRIGTFDLLVHTARQEPFGLVYLEAMARGVPVIGPPAGGSAEIVRPGIDGLLVDVTDAGRLAGAVVALLRDPVLRAAMGTSGRQRIAEHFTVEAMAEAAWDLVTLVARERQPSARRRRSPLREP